jgi:transposase InsO family protein
MNPGMYRVVKYLCAHVVSRVLLHHSDQGCTSASEDYRSRLKQQGITCSMSRRGNCYENAVMEGRPSTMKSEEGERFESYLHAKRLVRLYRSAL